MEVYYPIISMKIVWIQKSSLLEYPGKVSCVIFTQWCNFRCPFCHNPECVLPEQMMLFTNELISEPAFFNFLENRKGFIDGVSICWWEPTLQPDLFEFIKEIKDRWFLVKLDTNGRDWKIIQRLLEHNLVDYMAVDLKHTMYLYDQAVGLEQTAEFFQSYQKLLEILLESGIDYEYRTTVIKGMHTAEDIQHMAHYIRGVKHYYLQNYVGGNTLDPNFGWQPFTDEELNEFSEIAQKYVQHCWIRK